MFTTIDLLFILAGKAQCTEEWTLLQQSVKTNWDKERNNLLLLCSYCYNLNLNKTLLENRMIHKEMALQPMLHLCIRPKYLTIFLNS